LGAGAKACTRTLSRSLTVSHSITISTNGTLSHTSTQTSRLLSLTGNWTNSGRYAGSRSSSSVTFGGTHQFVGGTSFTGFRRLTINARSFIVLGGHLGVTNTLSVSGTLDPGAGSGFVLSGAGTLSVASGGKLLVRASTFTAKRGTTVAGTLKTVGFQAVCCLLSGCATHSGPPPVAADDDLYQPAI